MGKVSVHQGPGEGLRIEKYAANPKHPVRLPMDHYASGDPLRQRQVVLHQLLGETLELDARFPSPVRGRFVFGVFFERQYLVRAPEYSARAAGLDFDRCGLTAHFSATSEGQSSVHRTRAHRSAAAPLTAIAPGVNASKTRTGGLRLCFFTEPKARIAVKVEMTREEMTSLACALVALAEEPAGLEHLEAIRLALDQSPESTGLARALHRIGEESWGRHLPVLLAYLADAERARELSRWLERHRIDLSGTSTVARLLGPLATSSEPPQSELVEHLIEAARRSNVAVTRICFDLRQELEAVERDEYHPETGEPLNQPARFEVAVTAALAHLAEAAKILEMHCARVCLPSELEKEPVNFP